MIVLLNLISGQVYLNKNKTQIRLNLSYIGVKMAKLMQNYDPFLN
jgi:hypothetical protein